MQKITIKKINQNYLNNLVSVNKKISSGRKNYQHHYNRILKNNKLQEAKHKRKKFYKNYENRAIKKENKKY